MTSSALERIPPTPDILILTPTDGEALRLAARGDLTCPRCQKNKLVAEPILEPGAPGSVMLLCVGLQGCGWREI